MIRRPGPVSGPDMNELSSLAAAAARGERDAVRSFVVAIGPMVLRVVRQVLGAMHPDVEDVVQESLVATLDALPRFRTECTLRHFVCRVALLTALNARRRHQLRDQVLPPAPWEEAAAQASVDDLPSERVDAARRRELFATLLDELPAVQAEAIAMHCVLGYTVEETAAACGVPLNTVRSRLLAAKAALRQRVEASETAVKLLRGAS